MFNPADRESLDRRIRIVFWMIVLCFLIFFTGFWYIQVIRGSYYEELAKQNIWQAYPLPAPRGLIVDRNNQVLAENRLSHNLFITPGLSRNLENTLDFLSNVLATTPDELKRFIRKDGSLRSQQPLLIYQDLSLPQLAYISARRVEYPELNIKQETNRSYRYGELFSHVLGYVGELTEEQSQHNTFPGAKKRDVVGQAGLERYYNHYLMGEPGFESKLVNSYGVELKVKEFQPRMKPAVPGNIIRTGLDYNMQKAAQEAFLEKGRYGSAVAMNIKTGEVMALYSDPEFNPNDFIPRIPPAKWKELLSDDRHPLQNRVIQNKFSPGSTFKTVMALAALQGKVISPDTTFFCGGSQFIYNRTFRCWKPGGHGYVDLQRAIEQSCDVYFYNVGMRMDIDDIAKYAKLLGLGDLTMIDLFNENAGLVPSREWKRKATGDKWYQGETISVAVGQGPVLVTALQLASLYATIASDGMKIRPHLLDAVLNLNGTVLDVAPSERKEVVGIDRRNYEIVKQALWGVVNGNGTGSNARLDGYDVCGKTGTVQVVGYERGGELWKTRKEEFGDHAWFVAFAPYSDPQIAVAVFVEHGGHGSDAAAPVAKKILEAYFRDRKIPPFPAPSFAPNRKSAPLDEPAQVATANTPASGEELSGD